MQYRIERLYTYIITHDSGFSPNPFWGICTLACCKPKIRLSIGEHWNPRTNTWVMGITPKALGHEVVYIMKVTGCLTFPEYFYRFPEKIPDFTKPAKFKCGDNIYKPKGTVDVFEQLRSFHSTNPFDDEDWSVHTRNTHHDLSGRYVLTSTEFVYFGRESVPLPDGLESLIAGRGHKCKFSPEILGRVEEWVNHYAVEISERRIIAPPHRWPRSDRSWKVSSCGSS